MFDDDQMTDCERQLRAIVRAIADEITNPPEVTEDGLDPEEEGYRWDEDANAYLDEDGDEIQTRTKSASDLMGDALDIEYTVSGHDRAYLGASICMTFGGPGVYIDTRRRVVVGVWAGDRFEASYRDNMGLDDFCAEMWEAGA